MDGTIRTQLKRNFLKEIIMRLDYQGVLQSELDNVVLGVKAYLKAQSFNRYTQKVNNQALLGDTTVKEASSQIVHSFSSDNKGFSLEFSPTCMILTVRPTGYVRFEVYSSIFCYLAKTLSERIDFFSTKRFGLRKINFCFFKNISTIEEYFKPEYYSISEPVYIFGIGGIRRHSQLTDGKRVLNLNHFIEQGELDNEAYYKVTLDSDIYSTDEDTIRSLLENEETMISANNVLFKAYYNALTEHFVALLSNEDDPLPEGLIGVDFND